MNALFLKTVIALACASIAKAQTGEPAELTRLRSSYDSAVQRAVKPLSETYLAELTKLRDTYTKAAKLDEAVKIAEEIKHVRERLGLITAPAGEARAEAPVAGQELRITIPANDPNGYRIGAVKRGDEITLQYIEGMWKNHGGIATANPDDPKVDGGDENRLAIARGAVNGAPGELIKLVPGDTRKKIFRFIFPTSREEVVLRINTNSDRKQNPGAVVYSMKLTR